MDCGPDKICRRGIRKAYAQPSLRSAGDYHCRKGLLVDSDCAGSLRQKASDIGCGRLVKAEFGHPRKDGCDFSLEEEGLDPERDHGENNTLAQQISMRQAGRDIRWHRKV